MCSKCWIAPVVAVAMIGLVACGGGGGSEEAAATPEASSTPAPATESAPEPAAPATQTAGEMGSASVRGTIRFEGDVPNLRPLRMDADPGCAKKHDTDVMPEVLVLGENNALANVFVRVTEGISGSYSSSEPVVLDQEGCRYTPHVVGVLTGQPFKILNSDGLLHNVHGLPEKNSAFNRAMPAAVTEADYVFDSEEIFKIKCDVHPWMGAWVGVSSHPFFDVSTTDGTFEIASLPAGDYTIEAWHERLGAQTATISVAEGDSVESNFVFTVN